MIPGLLILFLSILVMLRSFSKTRFFFQMIKKGLINPNHEDLQRINAMLKDKKNHPFFSIIFKEILFLQIKIFLNKSKREEFICSTNFLLKNINQYHIDPDKLWKSIGKILDRYDYLLQRKIHSYTGPLQGPIIKLLRNVYKIRGYNEDFMLLSFFAIKDSLLTLIGKPLVNDNLAGYILDSNMVCELEQHFDDRLIVFIGNLVKIRPAA